VIRGLLRYYHTHPAGFIHTSALMELMMILDEKILCSGSFVLCLNQTSPNSSQLLYRWIKAYN